MNNDQESRNNPPPPQIMNSDNDSKNDPFDQNAKKRRLPVLRKTEASETAEIVDASSILRDHGPNNDPNDDGDEDPSRHRMRLNEYNVDNGNLLVDLMGNTAVSTADLENIDNIDASGDISDDDDVDSLFAGKNSSNDYDSEFMDLLKDFAQMDIPKYYSTHEKCPICSADFKIEDYAEHVYSCIKVLEPEEQRQMDEMSTELAYALAMEEMLDYDLLGALQQKTGFDLNEAQQEAQSLEMKDSTPISNGDSAMGAEEAVGKSKAQDIAQNITHQPAPKSDYLKEKFERFLANQALVFNQYKFHQKGIKMGECCVCGMQIPYNELDQHVLGCLNTSPEYRLGKGKKSKASVSAQIMGDSTSSSKTVSRTAVTAVPPTQAAPVPRVLAFRGGDDEDDFNTSTVSRGDDHSDDDEDTITPLPQIPRVIEQTSPSIDITTSAATSDLNARQIGLMARMVHDRANNQNAQESSLNDLLTQFKALGLNKESLRRAKDDLLNDIAFTSSTTTDGQEQDKNNNI